MTQGRIGSVVSVVAAELSTMSCPPSGLKAIALAKLSLEGGGAATMNVGSVTVAVVRVVPPPGGGVRTPTEFVLPYPVMKLPGMVADSCVEDWNVVGIMTRPCG